MTKNMGQLDRIARVAFAIVVAALYGTNRISGTLAIVLGAFALVFVASSAVSWCPGYSLFGWSTRGKGAS